MNRWINGSGAVVAVWLLGSTANAQTAPAVAKKAPVATAAAPEAAPNSAAKVAPSPEDGTSPKIAKTTEKALNQAPATPATPGAVVPPSSAATPTKAPAPKSVASATESAKVPLSKEFPPELAPKPLPIRKALQPTASPATDAGTGGLRLPGPNVFSQPEFNAWVGMSTAFVGADSFDFFSDKDTLSTTSLGLGWAPTSFFPPGIAVVAAIDVGGTKSSVREQATELKTTRMALGLELRSSLLKRLDYFLRFSGTAAHLSAEMDESSSGVLLTDKKWSAGLEANFGLLVTVAKIPTKNKARPIELFAKVEAGYVWMASTDMNLDSTSSNAPVRLEPIALRNVKLTGDQLRLAVGIGF